MCKPPLWSHWKRLLLRSGKLEVTAVQLLYSKKWSGVKTLTITKKCYRQNLWSIQLQTSGFSLFWFSVCILIMICFLCRESRMGPRFLKYKSYAKHSFPFWSVLNCWILSFSCYDPQGFRPNNDFRVFLSNSRSEITVSITDFPSFGFALTFGSWWLKNLKCKIHSILFSLRKLIKESYSGRDCIKLLSSACQDIRRSLFPQSLGPESNVQLV